MFNTQEVYTFQCFAALLYPHGSVLKQNSVLSIVNYT